MVTIRLSRRKKYAIVSIVLVAVLLELYAHTYVEVHALSVVPEDEGHAKRSGPGDSYRFVQGNCEWVFTYVIERPAHNSHNGYVWAYIFKIGENKSVFTGPTSLLVSNVKLSHIKDVYFYFDPDEQVFYDNYTGIRLDLDFQGNGSYPIHIDVNLNFYQQTVIGIIPVGQVSIPIDATVVAWKDY